MNLLVPRESSKPAGCSSVGISVVLNLVVHEWMHNVVWGRLRL
jgi:hypothetical protein